METNHLLELVKSLEAKKKGKKEELERFKVFFNRFHLLNRNYLDKETFEQSLESISSMTGSIVNTIQYLEEEIGRLRSKRVRLPIDNVTLGEMQKVQNRNESLIKEFISGFEK
jgi:hypothetical protein